MVAFFVIGSYTRTKGSKKINNNRIYIVAFNRPRAGISVMKTECNERHRNALAFKFPG